MDEAARLMEMTRSLDMPVQVSSEATAVRGLAQKVSDARSAIAASGSNLPSCGGVAGGWGN